MGIESEERRLVEAFAQYAGRYGEIKTMEDGTEIIVPESDCVRFTNHTPFEFDDEEWEL